MYTVFANQTSYKEFLIKGFVPSKDQHKQLAEQFRTGGYDSLSFQPRSLHHFPTCSIDFIEEYTGLKSLSIAACDIVDIGSISALQPYIQSLGLGESKSKKDLYFITSLKNLEHLYVHGTSKNVDAISALQNLLTLSISSLDVGGLQFDDLQKLYYLYISHNCKNLEITNISSLVNLKGISFLFVSNMSDFSFLSSFKGLVGASFVWVPKLTQLPDLSDLTQLKTLEFDTCRKLIDPRFINTNNSIENLLALNCDINPPLLKGLDHHPSLQRVCISFNSKKKQQEAVSLLGTKRVALSQELFKYEIFPTFVKKIDTV